MRAADYPHKDATKTQILQTAQENANYTQRLEQLNQRTQLLAKDGIAFQVKSTWRIRVGGHRGPESILLPAFDALGMPYIPSSTLRGVARNQAIREIMATNNLEWKEAEKEIAPYFGDINAKEEKNKTGKVVFFDAYPLPSKNGGLEMDMANNIWSWKDDSMEYSPNPNPFLSLKEPTFLIGLRLASNCEDEKILEKVKQWLKKGLQLGIGSQVNTGYGQLIFDAMNGKCGAHPLQKFVRQPLNRCCDTGFVFWPLEFYLLTKFKRLKLNYLEVLILKNTVIYK